MFLYVFCLYCVLQLLYTTTYCDDDESREDNKYHRFIKEDGFKPPIFGSYIYDPIKQVFEGSKDRHIPQIFNNSYVLSTAGELYDDKNQNQNSFTISPWTSTTTRLTSTTTLPAPERARTFEPRHRVNIPTVRPTQWWARKLTNITGISRFNLLVPTIKYNY